MFCPAAMAQNSRTSQFHCNHSNWIHWPHRSPFPRGRPFVLSWVSPDFRSFRSFRSRLPPSRLPRVQHGLQLPSRYVYSFSCIFDLWVFIVYFHAQATNPFQWTFTNSVCSHHLLIEMLSHQLYPIRSHSRYLLI